MATQNAMSNYLENKILTDYLVTGPAHVALFTANPTDADTGTEVSGGGYARQAATFTVSTNSASNSVEVDYGQASANWGNVTHFAIYDATTGGNLLFHGALEDNGGNPATFTTNNGDTFKFPVSGLTITLD